MPASLSPDLGFVVTVFRDSDLFQGFWANFFKWLIKIGVHSKATPLAVRAIMVAQRRNRYCWMAKLGRILEEKRFIFSAEIRRPRQFVHLIGGSVQLKRIQNPNCRVGA